MQIRYFPIVKNVITLPVFLLMIMTKLGIFIKNSLAEYNSHNSGIPTYLQTRRDYLKEAIIPDKKEYIKLING
jgi:hypothetical protein